MLESDNMEDYHLSKGEIVQWRPRDHDLFVNWNEEDFETLRKASRHRVKELLHDFLNK